MARSATRRARLEARVTEDQKALFEQAAALQGISLTDFLVQSARAAAQETLRGQQILLTATESRRLVELLMNPPEPSEALRAAATRRRALVGR